MIHSCGSSSWVFNDFIEMGIKIVDTLQPEAKDMSPAYPKKLLAINYVSMVVFQQQAPWLMELCRI